MKVTTQKITTGEEEVIIRYKRMTPRIKELIKGIDGACPTVLGRAEDAKCPVFLKDIYYVESVEDKCYACTREKAYQIGMTLAEAEEKYAYLGFFRCNKSFVLNIRKVLSVKSELGNRIDATLDNGEHIIISRHYAKAFRALLKEYAG